MHNSPENVSQSAPRKRSAHTSRNVIAGITVASAAALALIRGCDNAEPAVGHPAPAKAVDLDTTDIGPVSALTPSNMTEMDPEGDAVQAKQISFEKPIEKAPLKPGQPTIEELQEGVVPAGTQIRLRAGGQEGGQEYILIVDEKGLITINGKKYEQAAKAYKSVFGVKTNVATVILQWSEVKKVLTEDGNAVLEITGEPIDKSEEGKTDIYTEDDLVSMGANADSGKLIKPLGKRLGKNPLTGKKDVEVDVEWTIYPKK